jgi:hypothetical protein
MGHVSLGSKRLVTKLIAGWTVLPARALLALLCRGAVHVDVCAWVLWVRSGVCVAGLSC